MPESCQSDTRWSAGGGGHGVALVCAAVQIYIHLYLAIAISSYTGGREGRRGTDPLPYIRVNREGRRETSIGRDREGGREGRRGTNPK